MSTLFDITPNEPTKKRSARAKVVATITPVETPKKEPSYIGNSPAKAIKALGRLDHTHECADSMCRGSAHDILYEAHGDWLIQCCFCNTAQWVPVIAGHLKPKDEEFIFRDGRFSGMSIEEAVEQPRGREYVEWAAASHKRPAVQAACKTWLARFAPAV